MSMGECPICNGVNLDYGSVEFYDDQCYFPRECGDCGAECEKREDAYSQAREYLSNFGGEIRLYHYIIENPDIRFQVEDGEIDFYIDDNYLHMDEREDYGLGRCLIERLGEKTPQSMVEFRENYKHKIRDYGKEKADY